MWYRKALARRRAEVSLAKERILPDKPEKSVSGIGKPPRMRKQDLYALLAGGFAATMVLGPTRALKLASRGAGLASALLPPREPVPEHDTAEAPTAADLASTRQATDSPATKAEVIHLNGRTATRPMSHTAPYSKTP